MKKILFNFRNFMKGAIGTHRITIPSINKTKKKKKKKNRKILI